MSGTHTHTHTPTQFMQSHMHRYRHLNRLGSEKEREDKAMNRKNSFSSDDEAVGPDNTYKVIVRATDMNDAMQTKASNIIIESLTIYPKESQVAKHIKTQFDEKYGRAWQCIVGKHFARYAT